MENINEMTNEELDNLVVEIREIKKARKEEAKAAEKEAKENLKAENKKALDELEAGAVVRFTLKGEEVEAPLDKVTEKRFVAIVDGAKKAIMFDKLVEIVG